MKKLILTGICMMTAAGLAFGADETLTFDDLDGAADAGTYVPGDVFTIQVSLSWTGYTANGFSLWLETITSGLEGLLTITGRTAFGGTPFPDPNQSPSFPVSFTVDQGGGSFGTADPSDLGFTQNAGPAAASTYIVSTISFAISGTATPGTYTFQSSVTSPHLSVVTDSDFGDNPIPAEQYTLTVVPEPSTFALIGLTAAGVAFLGYRRTRRS